VTEQTNNEILLRAAKVARHCILRFPIVAKDALSCECIGCMRLHCRVLVAIVGATTGRMWPV